MAAILRTIFQINFLVWKFWNFDSKFTEICSQDSSYQYDSIGSDIGLSPNRRQASVWTNDDLFTDEYIVNHTSSHAAG